MGLRPLGEGTTEMQITIELSKEELAKLLEWYKRQKMSQACGIIEIGLYHMVIERILEAAGLPK